MSSNDLLFEVHAPKLLPKNAVAYSFSSLRLGTFFYSYLTELPTIYQKTRFGGELFNATCYPPHPMGVHLTNFHGDAQVIPLRVSMIATVMEEAHEDHH